MAPPSHARFRGDRRRLGCGAEERAAVLLRQAGCEILARNYRCRMGELDLVARRGRLLIIAEVRLRSSLRFGGAAASITAAKRRRIVRATRHLLVSHPGLRDLPVRFDAIVMAAADGAIEWIEGAFQ